MDNLFDLFIIYCQIKSREEGNYINLKRQIKNNPWRLFIIGVVIFGFTLAWGIPRMTWGYPIDNFSGTALDQSNRLSQTINETVRSLMRIELFKSYAGSFEPSFPSPGVTGPSKVSLFNAESFSGRDLAGIFKAVSVLFLQIVITAVGVLLGILKLALELVTNW